MPHVIIVLRILIVPTFAKISMNNPNVRTRVIMDRIFDVVSAKAWRNGTDQTRVLQTTIVRHTTATVVTRYPTVTTRTIIANVHTVCQIMIAEVPSAMQGRFHSVEVIPANATDMSMVIGSRGLPGLAARAPVGMVR